jgi:nucleotide-binding universal stress UspA family protein
VLFSLTAVSEYVHKKTILVLYALVPEGLKTKKIFGSNTSNLITHSLVPVIAVPSIIAGVK